ncbi:hypothetical protein OQA88_7391 [Cercophora sp. LCS_1]
MKFAVSIITILLAAIAGALALPSPSPPSTAKPGTSPAPSPAHVFDHYGYCWSFEFNNGSSLGSPFAADCLHMVDNIVENGGSWDTTLFGARTLVQYKTCHFLVQQHEGSNIVTFSVGDLDIQYIVNTAINKFMWDEQIGAWGYMMCGAHTDPGSLGHSIYWSIY